MLHHIQRLIAEGEHQQLDFKFEVSDTHKIARSLVAFANTDGGRLLIGIRDDGSISGIRTEEEFFMLETAARTHCKPVVEYFHKEWIIRKKTILEVVVKRSQNRPHFAVSKEGKWIAYIRVKDQNFAVNRILLRVWEKEHKMQGAFLKYTDNEKRLLTYLENNRTISLSKFVRICKISRNKAENILVNFLLLKILEIHFSENTIYYSLNPNADLKENL